MTGANLSAELLGTAYGFVRQLAMGGMGEVAVVEHVALGEQRVMKLLRADFAESTDLATRLRTEARLLTRLQHENLVRVLDFGFSSKGRPFLVTELLRGEPLSTTLKGVPALPEREALGIARQTLLGLERVHDAGFVHRDVKPDNLFLVKSGAATTVKILDFGVARILTPADRVALGQLRPTAEGMVVGTPSYLSPEQALGKPCDVRADIYGVAATLYRMLAGAPVFRGDTQLDILQAHVLETPSAPSVHRAEVSSGTDAVVLRGLAKKPEDRFQTARAMREAIELVLAANDARPTHEPAPAGRAIQAAVSVRAARGDGESAHGTVAVRSPLAPVVASRAEHRPTVRLNAPPALDESEPLDATTFPMVAPAKARRRKVAPYIAASFAVALIGLILLLVLRR